MTRSTVFPQTPQTRWTSARIIGVTFGIEPAPMPVAFVHAANLADHGESRHGGENGGDSKNGGTSGHRSMLSLGGR